MKKGNIVLIFGFLLIGSFLIGVINAASEPTNEDFELKSFLEAASATEINTYVEKYLDKKELWSGLNPESQSKLWVLLSDTNQKTLVKSFTLEDYSNTWIGVKKYPVSGAETAGSTTLEKKESSLNALLENLPGNDRNQFLSIVSNQERMTLGSSDKKPVPLQFVGFESAEKLVVKGDFLTAKDSSGDIGVVPLKDLPESVSKIKLTTGLSSSSSSNYKSGIGYSTISALGPENQNSVFINDKSSYISKSKDENSWTIVSSKLVGTGYQTQETQFHFGTQKNVIALVGTPAGADRSWKPGMYLWAKSPENTPFNENLIKSGAYLKISDSNLNSRAENYIFPYTYSGISKDQRNYAYIDPIGSLDNQVFRAYGTFIRSEFNYDSETDQKLNQKDFFSVSISKTTNAVLDFSGTYEPSGEPSQIIQVTPGSDGSKNINFLGFPKDARLILLGQYTFSGSLKGASPNSEVYQYYEYSGNNQFVSRAPTPKSSLKQVTSNSGSRVSVQDSINPTTSSPTTVIQTENTKTQIVQTPQESSCTSGQCPGESSVETVSEVVPRARLGIFSRRFSRR